MKLLIFGDIYGRVGRKALAKELGGLREKYSPDFIIANVDNATSGKGIIEKHAVFFENLGVDLMTSGDHIFDNFEKIKTYLDKEDSKLIRPLNFYDESFEGKGYKILEKNGKKLLVIHVLDEIFMPHKVNNPFLEVRKIVDKFKDSVDGIVIDFHKEVTSSIYGLLHYLKDDVSFIYGTHTHVQSNDDIIFDFGTGIINDVGMVGPLYGVIGAKYETVKNRFLKGINRGKIEQSLDKNYVVSGVFVDIENGNTKEIQKIRIINKL